MYTKSSYELPTGYVYEYKNIKREKTWRAWNVSIFTFNLVLKMSACFCLGILILNLFALHFRLSDDDDDKTTTVTTKSDTDPISRCIYIYLYTSHIYILLR